MFRQTSWSWCDQIIYEKEEEYRNWNVSQVIQTVKFKVSCVIKAGFVTCNSGFLQGLTDAYVMLMGFRNKTDHICPLKIGNKGTVPRKKKKAYHRLEVRMKQHISVGVNGKVVTIWSKLEEKESKGDVCESRYKIWHLIFAWALTVNRGVSLLMSSRETSTAMTPRMSWFWDFWERKKRRQKKEKENTQRDRKSHCKTCLWVLLFFLDESSPSVHSEWFQGNGVQQKSGQSQSQ